MNNNELDWNEWDRDLWKEGDIFSGFAFFLFFAFYFFGFQCYDVSIWIKEFIYL